MVALVAPRLDDLLGDVEAALTKLIAAMPPLDVARVARVRNQVEFVWLRAVDSYACSGEWADEGYVKAASGIREKARVSQGTANFDVNLAHKLRALPRAADALARGEISRQHVIAVATAHTPARAVAVEGLEPQLLDAAKIATAQEFVHIVRRVTDALDGDDGTGTENALHEQRRLHLSETFQGMWKIDGLLDREAGRKMAHSLQARMWAQRKQRSGRTTAQHRADVLVELLECGEAHAERGPGRNAITDLSIHIDLADLESRGGRAVADEIRGRADYKSRLPRETLRRLSCDCRIARVVTDGPGRVLDVGRATRTVPISIWRALVARDEGCMWSGCDRPPGWCDAHHIVHWEDGGPTSLENLRLLCRRHHRLVHEGGHDPPEAS